MAKKKVAKKKVAPKKRGRAGRPRKSTPSDSKERTRFMVNFNKDFRDKLEWLRAELGLSHAADAIRLSVRNQIRSLKTDPPKKGDAAPNVEMPGDLKQFQIWVNADDRKRMDKLRRGYKLETDADAVRFALQEEINRVKADK